MFNSRAGVKPNTSPQKEQSPVPNPTVAERQPRSDSITMYPGAVQSTRSYSAPGFSPVRVMLPTTKTTTTKSVCATTAPVPTATLYDYNCSSYS